jgi:hypothetical protein
VVRLPREWIGPLEELVPIRPATEAGERSAEIVAGEVPPAADAFWSEDAGALHNAVQAPPAAASGLPEPAAVQSRATGTRDRLRVRLRPPWAALWSRCARLRPAHIGAVAAVAVLVLVAAIGTLWESGPGGAPASSARHQLARVGNPGAQTRRPSTPSRGPVAEGAAAHRSAGLDRAGHRIVSGRHRGALRKPLRGHPRGTARRSGIHRSRPSPAAATAEPVAASTVNSGAASSYSPAGGPPTPTTPPATTAPVSQSASGSGGSSASSGSSSSPAFGPSGILGPGSSPNS